MRTGWLSMALATVVSLGIPCTARSAEPYGDDQIEVTLSEPFTIASAPPTFCFPTLHQLAPKSLLLAVWSAPDDWLKEEDRRQTLFYTEDGGTTWGKPLVKSGIESGGHSFVRRKDGTCIWLDFLTYRIDARTVSCSVGRSNDGKDFTWSKGVVQFPQDVLAWKNDTSLMMFCRSILELNDGSLLATMFGSFDADVSDKDKSNLAGIRYRTVLVRSTDNGAHWDYYSTVAFSPDAPGDGYCEPVLGRTIDGNLLCVMRLGSNLPMQSCSSSDDGRTWSAPRVLPDDAVSVFPDMVLMGNGVLAMSFGRPGIYLMFSVDGRGERWTSRTTLYDDPHWPTPCSTCAYTALREVAPGRLLCVYSFLENAIKPGAPSHIRGVFVDVKKSMPKATHLTNPLAIRIMNYGEYQDAAWTHLPSIGMHHIFLSTPAADQMPAVQKRLADSGLKPLVLRGDTDLGRESSVDELAAQLAVCEKMGVHYMFLSPKHTGVGKEVACERLRRAGDAAKKHGVTIVLETHRDLGTNGDVHLETMKAINHPNVRVNFDTGNITFYNKGTDAVTELKKIIDYVATVELKDHNGEYEAWNFPTLGKGVVDFPAILKLLEEHGFQGPITMEVEGVQGVKMSEEQTKKYIAESIAYIQSLGDFR